ncbi:MAG: GH3 auxin-responsive promoter family protein [Alphaproteobacteria bacterium]|nr:GH3 auxin-responsive promoter family protein [Alphaproteobacteria bacterium]
MAVLDATPLLRMYARWRLGRLARQDAVAEQQRQLLRLVGSAAVTRFGRDHGFAKVASVDDYQTAVPLRRFEDFWQAYWQPSFPRLHDVTWPGTIPYFALSSGTSSGVTKHIPVSQAMVKANERAAIDLLVHHVANRPRSRIFGGRNFMLGGSAALKPLAPGILAGDLSGLAAGRVPWWARPRFFPNGPLAELADWETKTRLLARQSLQEDIRSMSGTPSWMLLFFEELQRLAPADARPLGTWYPHLEMLVHGGVSFAPYRSRFAELLAGSHAEAREVYPASEGFVAIADRGPDEGLRLLADNGLFFEFVPTDELASARPTRHWLGTTEIDLDYAVVVTSCAGLWSYILGDTVRFIDLHPPRLFVTGRSSYGLSAFGEHLTGEQIDRAVAAAAEAIGGHVIDYTVGPVFQGRGHHLYLVEFQPSVSAQQLAAFCHTVDSRLAAANADYAEHRKGDFGMDPPRAKAVAPGSFAAWMKARGKLGAQNKVPRVVADGAAFKDLCGTLSVS